MKVRAERIRAQDLNVAKTIGGYWNIATVVNGERVSCNYNGWTKRRAIADFLREVNGGAK